VKKDVSREEFDLAVEALWGEIEYQNTLSRRTDDEAKDIPGFLTLSRRYSRHIENDWADYPSDPETGQVEIALHGLRKLTAVHLRAMIYCGIRGRL